MFLIMQCCRQWPMDCPTMVFVSLKRVFETTSHPAFANHLLCYFDMIFRLTRDGMLSSHQMPPIMSENGHYDLNHLLLSQLVANQVIFQKQFEQHDY